MPPELTQLDEQSILVGLFLRALIVGAAAAISHRKGKQVFAGLGVIGILIPPLEWFAIVGAIRLAKPTSPWAQQRYDAVKLEQARARFPDSDSPIPRLGAETLPGNEAAGWSVGDFVIVVLGGVAGAVVGATTLLAGVGAGGVLLTTLFGQYVGHLLALWAVIRRRRTSAAGLGLVVEPRDGLHIFFGVFLQAVVALAVTPIARLLEVEGSQQAITELILDIQGTGRRVALVLAVAFFAPIVEETLFRGVLYRAVERRRGAGWAIVISSAVWALFHLPGVGSTDPLKAAALLLPQFFLLGLVLGRQVHKHGRLGVPIFTHAGFNLVAVLTLLLAPDLASSF